MSVLSALFILVGSLLLLIAAWGVIILPNALARQHAATKGGTLALALICLGALLMIPQPSWAWRLLLIASFMLFTLPVASHLLARAAVREANIEDEVANAPLVGKPPPE